VVNLTTFGWYNMIILTLSRIQAIVDEQKMEGLSDENDMSLRFVLSLFEPFSSLAVAACENCLKGSAV